MHTVLGKSANKPVYVKKRQDCLRVGMQVLKAIKVKVK